MKNLEIYIASSWRNQHAVTMLTELLRLRNHVVNSFVENNHGEFEKGVPVEDWIASAEGEQSFRFDTTHATDANLLIYIGPSGCDAWAEVGAAWASNVNIIGLRSKGEQVGLMRRMIPLWFDDVDSLLAFLDSEPIR